MERHSELQIWTSGVNRTVANESALCGKRVVLQHCGYNTHLGKQRFGELSQVAIWWLTSV